MNSSLSFHPVQGSEYKIKAHSITDGNIYFATDTGKMFMDANGKRISVGGAGAAIYYAEGTAVEDVEGFWIINKGDMVNSADSPSVDDIILNISDGSFYKIDEITNTEYHCSRLAISGSGGGPSATLRPSLAIETPDNTNIINGATFGVWFTATSALDAENVPLDQKLTINWKLYDGNPDAGGIMYYNSTFQANSGERTYLDCSSYLKNSTTSTLTITASSANHDGSSPTRRVEVTTTNMTLTLSSGFSNTNPFDSDKVRFSVEANGKVEKSLDVYFDGKILDPAKYNNVGGKLSASTEGKFDIVIPKDLCSHGAHQVKVELYQIINGTKAQSVEPIKFEVAVVHSGNMNPIVWFGDYSDTYFTYDTIQIPYLAYDPSTPDSAKVYLYKNSVQYKDEERVVTNRSKFQIWEIFDAENKAVNKYQIDCGKDLNYRKASRREIEFKVEQDPRDLTVAKKDYLRLSFDPKGRSNNESKIRRKKWSYTNSANETINAIFENFNWYNNGWRMDENNRTYLRISNGAKFTLPLGKTIFAGGKQNEQSHTFELMFKVRNVQNYSDLITNVTRYTLNGAKDDDLYKEYQANPDFDNYDAFLQWKLQGEYDNLKFAYVDKLINLNNAVCKYCVGSGQDVIGWAFGSQDAFFKDGSKTVSVPYVENEPVSLTIVFNYNANKSMIQFYLNGVITGVAYTTVSSFEIDSDLLFDSANCDIDLYKLRVYETALDVQEVVRNYCVDRTDIDNFDMLGLAKENTQISEYQISYDEVIAWNKNNPNNQTMPYIVFDTSKSGSDDRLPWTKSKSFPVSVTFVNTILDRAYETGALEELAAEDGLFDKNDENVTAEQKAEAVKLYYKHHCPSWVGNNCDLGVQGTSSEYYPRRNYKVKTKTKYDADKEERIHIFLNKGPFEEAYKEDAENTRQKYWYMNNYTGGTHKWTMKVDFMESSGSYNAGFASMVGTAYTKHPLEDYVGAGAINPIVTEYKKDENGEPTTEIKKQYNGLAPEVKFTTTVESLDKSNSNIRWNDYRTSLLGFPVMAFHKKSDGTHTFIGYYRMLLDKGSDEVLGFKPPKGVAANFLGNKDVRKKTECWEFSNNNRTYCSYRDPWDRVELSFMPPQDKVDDETGLTAAGVPIVADSFEYRYNDNEDYLDILYGMGKKTDGEWGYAGSEEDAEAFLEETKVDIRSTDNWPAAREVMLDYYKHWEKACKWVWSTCIDNVISLAGDGSGYSIVPVGDTEYKTDGSLYIYNAQEDKYDPITIGEFSGEIDYWKIVKDDQSKDVFVRAYVYDPMDKGEDGKPKYKYEADKFYINVDGVYSLSSDGFDSLVTYYTLTIDEDYVAGHSNLLIAPAAEYVEGTQYYTYNPTITNTQVMGGELAVQPVTITAEEFAAGKYYIAAPVTYGSNTYYYDTKEYRAEKFKRELSSHFDLEYMSTYFIMTEVFECYDSRGKNCMMASWGPLKNGGEYVWYPIFYDIDTQLGINNTGIPSFTFNIDATLNDNYSTSDSVLWNNFYSYFKGSYILQKYKHLKGLDSTIFKTALKNPPLKSIDNIEDWYLFDYDVTNNLATQGQRPLIATNLDAWYKYITITNTTPNAPAGSVGYLGRGGTWTIDTNGTYFYALQGDRKQSRRSFLTKRIDYTDSWLGVGDYARSGDNCIWGRVSANDFTDTSDIWLEDPTKGENYWILDEDGKETKVKTHAFDAQYWLDLKPIYSTYVTVSDDSAAYPSVKYDGKNAVQFIASAIESGVRRSPNYKEQLLYIYGSDKMLDIGDMSNLYWREFKIDGKASKLTRLKLGHDGIVNDYTIDENGDKQYSNMKWKNGYLNQPSIPAGKGSSGMPLLKEANFCNITIQAAGSDPVLDLYTCEKLQNFRATGSNLAQITFADGVALDTAYLPAALTSLSLKEANLLTKVLKEYSQPVTKESGLVEAEQGLYIEGFFDNVNSKLKSLYLEGGSLGYGSFDLFKRFYDLKKDTENNRLSLLDVDWCPYVQVIEGDEYDENLSYYVDDEHYGLSEYTYTDDKAFKGAIVRGELYYLDAAALAASKDEDGKAKINSGIYKLLKELVKDTNFRSVENVASPVAISGTIFIDNSDGEMIDEAEIATDLQAHYPNLKIFMTNVSTAYSAKFVIVNKDGSYSYVPDINGDTTYPSIQKVARNDVENGTVKTFGNPFDLYNLEDVKPNYVFVGWSTNPNADPFNENEYLSYDKRNQWGTGDYGVITKGEYNQTYYAIFQGQVYTATFTDAENLDWYTTIQVQFSEAGSYFHTDLAEEPLSIQPVADEERYGLVGWTLTESQGGSYAKGIDVSQYLVDVSKIAADKNITLYAVYQLENVRDTHSDYKYFNIIYDSAKGYYCIRAELNYLAGFKGKLTIPAKTPQGDDILEVGVFYDADNSPDDKTTPSGITHIFFENGSKYHTIGVSAFSLKSVASATSLKKVYLPDTITRIEADAFKLQTALETVAMGDNVEYIGDSAFRQDANYTKLKMNSLPKNLKEIGQRAFEQNNIEISELPNSLKVIGKDAFKNAKKVKIDSFGSDANVVNGSQLEVIGEGSFSMGALTDNAASELNAIYVFKSVKMIGDNAFYNYGTDTTLYTSHDSTDWDAATIGVQSISHGYVEV